MTSGSTVAHLTSVHAPDDPRIAVRECVSLQTAGYDVVLVAPDVRPPLGRLPTVLIPAARNRLSRMATAPWKVLGKALRLRAAVYHLHDPELIPIGLLLKALGRRVIYDAHEDIGRQVIGKGWIPRPMRPAVSIASRFVERLAGRFFDGVVVVTPISRSRFPRSERVAVIRNVPLLREFLPDDDPIPHADREPLVVYVGSVTKERGLWTMVEAIGRVNIPGVRLAIAGDIPPGLRALGRDRPGWERVEALGWQSRDGVRDLLRRARVGLAVLKPMPNYLDSYPTKLFEYMAAGLPSVVSDFPPWRAVIEEAGCGIALDPLDVERIAAAIMELLSDPAKAELMGRSGRAAIERDLNWEAEATKLIDLYAAVLAMGR